MALQCNRERGGKCQFGDGPSAFYVWSEGDDFTPPKPGAFLCETHAQLLLGDARIDTYYQADRDALMEGIAAKMDSVQNSLGPLFEPAPTASADRQTGPANG